MRWHPWIFVVLAVGGIVAGSEELLALALVWFGFAVLAALALLVGAFQEAVDENTVENGAEPVARADIDISSHGA